MWWWACCIRARVSAAAGAPGPHRGPDLRCYRRVGPGGRRSWSQRALGPARAERGRRRRAALLTMRLDGVGLWSLECVLVAKTRAELRRIVPRRTAPDCGWLRHAERGT